MGVGVGGYGGHVMGGMGAGDANKEGDSEFIKKGWGDGRRGGLDNRPRKD